MQQVINILKSETLASFGVSRVDEPIIKQHTIEKLAAIHEKPRTAIAARGSMLKLRLSV